MISPKLIKQSLWKARLVDTFRPYRARSVQQPRVGLYRARSGFLASDFKTEMPSTVFSLAWHVWRAARRTLMRASEHEGQLSAHAGRGKDAAAWLMLKESMTGPGSAEAVLEAIEVTAAELYRALVAGMPLFSGSSPSVSRHRKLNCSFCQKLYFL